MDFNEASQWNSSEPTPPNDIAGPLPRMEAVVPLLCLKQRHLTSSFGETHGLSSRGLESCLEQLQSITDWHGSLHQPGSSQGKLKMVRKAREVQDEETSQKMKTEMKKGKGKWICELCSQEIAKNHVSVLCNWTMTHWIHLKCGNVNLKDYKKQTSWTCKLHKTETEKQRSVLEESGVMEKSELQTVTGRRRIMTKKQKLQTVIEKVIECSITKRESRIIETTPQKSQFDVGLQNDISGMSVSPRNDSSIGYEHLKVLSDIAAVSSTSIGTSNKSIIGLHAGASVAATPKLNTSTCMDQLPYLKQTKKKPYPCPYEPECLQAFVRAAELKRHILVHTGKQPFKCPVCPFRTNRNFTLKQHCLHQHNINPEDPIFLKSSSDAFQPSDSTTNIGTVTDAIIDLPSGASVAALTPVLNTSTCRTEAQDQDKTRKKSYQCPNEPVSSLVITSSAVLSERTLRCPVCPFGTNRKFKFWHHCLAKHDINPEDPILIQ